MIESIQHKGLKLLWEKNNTSKLPSVQIFKIRMILNLLDNAVDVKDMDFPGSDLHSLKGNLAGFWAVKVNGNYRVMFRFENENAFDVDYMLKRGMAPVHPGVMLKGLYLEPMEITITQAASKLGVARKTLSQLVNGHMGVSAEMAIRLSKALNTTPQLWMNMQQGYDLWIAEKKAVDIKVVPFAMAS
jgi:addiction module HigA family antidote